MVSFLAASLLWSASCTPKDDEPTEEQRFELLYEREQAKESQAPRADIDALVEGNTAFALDYWRQLREGSQEPNLVASPFSISRAFALYYQGENANAAFTEVFRFLPQASESWQAFEGINASAIRTSSKPEESAFESMDVYWVDVSSKTTPEHYDRVHALPLKEASEESRGIINDWVKERSKGLIEDLLPMGAINPLTVAVTTNVVYFLGKWGSEFEKTDPIDFQAPDGERSAAAIRTVAEMPASVGEQATVVRVPYTNGFSLALIMPQDLDSLAEELDAEQLRELLQSTQRYEVTLKMPSFQQTTEPDLNTIIAAMRKKTGTEDTGTLTGAYDEAFFHKAAIRVDETGTEAAAATAIVEYENNAPEPAEPLEVTIDRPFLYLVIDDYTGSILFLGQVTQP